MKTKPAPKKSAKRCAATPVTRDTFTVRDMNRQPQMVLTAARKLGSVVVRSRTAGSFVITPEHPAPNKRVQEARAFCERLAAMRAKMRSMGFVPPSKADSEKITRMIAGDDP